jgi:hypothetical protein
MCKQLSLQPHSSLYKKEPYIGNLPIKHIGISKVGFCLIDSFYSLLVTTQW